jgi:hypothetical protein
MRITAVRDLLRASNSAPFAASDSTWQTNLAVLRAVVPHARRIESVSVTPRFDVRQRDTRREARAEAWSLAKAAWAARGQKLTRAASASASPATPAS